MSRLLWAAQGLAAAERLGGVTLELYRRPGFTRELAVRAVRDAAGGKGFEDPGPDDEEETDARTRAARRRRRS